MYYSKVGTKEMEMAKFLGNFHDKYDCEQAWLWADQEYQALLAKCMQLEALWGDVRKVSMSEDGFEDLDFRLEDAVLEFQATLQSVRKKLDEATIAAEDA